MGFAVGRIFIAQKTDVMKTIVRWRSLLALMVSCLFLACSSQSKIAGTASDRSGTNGATNGTGKIAKSL